MAVGGLAMHKHVHLGLPDDAVHEQEQDHPDILQLARLFHSFEGLDVASLVLVLELGSAVLLGEADRVTVPRHDGKRRYCYVVGQQNLGCVLELTFGYFAFYPYLLQAFVRASINGSRHEIEALGEALSQLLSGFALGE